MQCPFCKAELTHALKPMERPGLTACAGCMNPVVYKTDGPDCAVEAPHATQDVRTVAPPESIGGQVLHLAPRALERLPILPEVAMRVADRVRDPDVSMAQLADLIARDQVITVKVLKLANSALYAGLKEITDVKAAVTRIGLKNTAATVNTIAASGIFKAPRTDQAEYMRNIWTHAVASAHCAAEVAAMCADPESDRAYAEALLHDVGKVLLLDIIVNGRSRALDAVRESPELFEEIMANYHGLMGLHVVQHWNLPPEFAITTYCHAHPSAVPDGAWQSPVAMVSLGSAVANASGYGVSDKEVSLLSHPATKTLGLSDIKLATLRVDLEDKLAPLFDLNE